MSPITSPRLIEHSTWVRHDRMHQFMSSSEMHITGLFRFLRDLLRNGFATTSPIHVEIRQRHDHSQEWFANDRSRMIPGRSHTLQEQLFVQFETFWRTSRTVSDNFSRGRGAVDHARPESSFLCPAPNDRLPVPVDPETAL